MLDRVLDTIDSRKDQSLALLKDFLRIPSVSTKPENANDVKHCAEWLADQIRQTGLSATVYPTDGHPIVVAKNSHQPGRPTVLMYGHYDVQPPEPLDLWTTPAFEPDVRKDENGFDAVYARGAVDDKGQVWCHVEAIRAFAGNLPVNVTMLIEGEEECGSGHLDAFVEQHADLLKADVCVISDTNQFARGLPAITYGLRGLCYMEVFVTGPDHDLHSGMYGGAVPNPANVLCQLIASLHDTDGRVTIPGFYDDVVPLSQEERDQWKKLPLTEEQFAAGVGIPFGNGEVGFTSIERKWARPTLDVNGLTSGYQGVGAKTVIASKASAKVSMRLVPKQDPAKIRAAFEKHLRDRCPKNVKIEFVGHGLSPGVLTPVESPAVQLAREALEIGFGVKPTIMREGGSIPVVGLIKKVLGIDTLLVGFGLPDDRVHSPNEKFDLDALHKGTRTAALLYAKLASL
ncbi:dipeptidase [Humisphaera borealis]|uniref:Dipeptidase n=1 Tax=Humisphaera borealis TaxID=2807512 RepID=A0A7M2WRT4_9BACT|nr:dipeptidase [Humisphaera borealis]QOV88227.1 dipeptidase [Humisphaera borealis]